MTDPPEAERLTTAAMMEVHRRRDEATHAAVEMLRRFRLGFAAVAYGRPEMDSALAVSHHIAGPAHFLYLADAVAWIHGLGLEPCSSTILAAAGDSIYTVAPLDPEAFAMVSS